MTAPVSHHLKRRIVVGVDGSEPSKEALRWAARQAAATHAVLEVVTTWAITSTAYPFSMPMPIPTAYDMGPEVEQELNEIIQEMRGEFPGTVFSDVVIEGRAGPALVATAADADLLVVGSRGHGAVVGALLGSVSEYCVTHATCPVVVVRHPKGTVVDEGSAMSSSARGN